MLCCFSLSPFIDRRRACTKPMAVSWVSSSSFRLCLCFFLYFYSSSLFVRRLRRKGVFGLCLSFCAYGCDCGEMVIVTGVRSKAAGHARQDRYTGERGHACRRSGKRLGRGAVCSWQRMTCAVGNDAPSSFCVCNKQDRPGWGFVQRFAGQREAPLSRAELYSAMGSKGPRGVAQKLKRQGRGPVSIRNGGVARFASIRLDSCVERAAAGQIEIVGRGGRGEEAHEEVERFRLGKMHKSSVSLVSRASLSGATQNARASTF